MSNSNVSKPQSSSKIKSIFLFLVTFCVAALVLFQVFSALITSLDVSDFYLEPEGLVLLLTVLSSLMTCVIGAVILDSVKGSKKGNVISQPLHDKTADQSKNVA